MATSLVSTGVTFPDATTQTTAFTTGSVSAAQLNVSGNGTTSQFLRSDGDGSFTWATPTDTNTTYSAGTGLSLGGTTFSTASGYNGYGARTVSTGSPSGGSDGDVWYKY